MDSDHSTFVADHSTVELYSGFKSHNNFARGGSAGLALFLHASGVAEDILVEDNLVSGEKTSYGHGHGGGGVWVTDGSSLFLRNSALRRNSVSFSSAPASCFACSHTIAHTATHLLSHRQRAVEVSQQILTHWVYQACLCMSAQRVY